MGLFDNSSELQSPARFSTYFSAASESRSIEGNHKQVDNEAEIIVLERQRGMGLLCSSVPLLSLRSINTKQPSVTGVIVGLISFFTTDECASVTSC